MKLQSVNQIQKLKMAKNVSHKGENDSIKQKKKSKTNQHPLVLTSLWTEVPNRADSDIVCIAHCVDDDDEEKDYIYEHVC